MLTNDPPFEQMQAVNNYWKQIGGANQLPGTVRSPDRFARASFFIEHMPDSVDYRQAAAQVLTVLKLDTSKHRDLHGCINDLLVPSEPFKPMW